MLMLTLVAIADTVRIRTGVLLSAHCLHSGSGAYDSALPWLLTLFGQADLTLSSVHSAELTNSTSGHLRSRWLCWRCVRGHLPACMASDWATPKDLVSFASATAALIFC